MLLVFSMSDLRGFQGEFSYTSCPPSIMAWTELVEFAEYIFTPLTKRPLGNTVPKYRKMKFLHPLVCLCTTNQIYINNYPL
jgi:hypothetical protein